MERYRRPAGQQFLYSSSTKYTLVAAPLRGNGETFPCEEPLLGSEAFVRSCQGSRTNVYSVNCSKCLSEGNRKFRRRHSPKPCKYPRFRHCTILRTDTHTQLNYIGRRDVHKPCVDRKSSGLDNDGSQTCPLSRKTIRAEQSSLSPKDSTHGYYIVECLTLTQTRSMLKPRFCCKTVTDTKSTSE